MAENIGKVIQIAGPAVDVQFNERALPPIHQAVRVTGDGFKTPQPIDVTLEIQQHLGEGWVRTIAMSSNEGLKRGVTVTATGAPISVPVGEGILGLAAATLGTAHCQAGGLLLDRRRTGDSAVTVKASESQGRGVEFGGRDLVVVVGIERMEYGHGEEIS